MVLFSFHFPLAETMHMKSAIDNISVEVQFSRQQFGWMENISMRELLKRMYIRFETPYPLYRYLTRKIGTFMYRHHFATEIIGVSAWIC